MQARPDDGFIVAASPLYLLVVENDLCAGRDKFASLEQLTIVTRILNEPRQQRALSRAAMIKALNTNMTGLNISYIVKI